MRRLIFLLLLIYSSPVFADTAHNDTLTVAYDAHRALKAEVINFITTGVDSVLGIGNPLSDATNTYSGYFLFPWSIAPTAAQIDSIKLRFKNQLARTVPAFKFIFKVHTGEGITIIDSTTFKAHLADSTLANTVWESNVGTTADVWYEFDVTSPVTEWITEGSGDSLGLFMHDNGSTKYWYAFANNDISEDAAPELVVWWTETDAPAATNDNAQYLFRNGQPVYYHKNGQPLKRRPE